MTFINPLMLFGLGLIAVPVIIHLFNLRKAVKVDFSSLMFIRKIEETQIKKLRLKELILMLIRILLITFLVFSFANPVLKSKFSFTDIKNKTAILFFDNSFSLNNQGSDRNNFEKSKLFASQLARFYNPTDNLIIFSGTGNLTALSDISGIEISHKPFYTNEIIETININLEKNKSILNEIIVISDFSRANFKEYTNDNISALDKENIYFYLLDISKKEPANISIQDVKLENEFLDLNTDMIFKVTIKNHNNYPVSSVEYNISNNKLVVSSGILDFIPQEMKEIEIRFRPSGFGEQKIETTINIPNPADDEIKEDNRYFNIISIPENYKIILITDNNENARYITKSFDVFNSAGQQDRIIYKVSNIITDDVYGYDAVYLLNSVFTESDINKLEKFSSEGKGIFIFPLNNMDLNYINSLLKRVSSFRIDAKETNAENVEISEIKNEHPLFRGVFKTSSGNNEIKNPESPELKSYYRIISGENTYSVISLNNGEQLVSEYAKGSSRIILSAISADFEMSDLPVKNYFLPMIIRGVFLLSNNQYLIRTIRINSDLLPDGIFTGNDTVYKPDGTKIFVSDNMNKDLSYKRKNYFNESGFYRIMSSNYEDKYIAINNDKNESFPEKIKENSLIDYFRLKGFLNLQYFDDIEDLKSALEKNRRGIELTPVFIILSVLFIFLEIIYSGFIMRRK